MSNVDDFRNLAREVENTYKDRTKLIRAMYQEGKREKKERVGADKQRHDDVERMKAGFNAEDQARAAANHALEKATDKLITDFTAESKAQAADVAKMFADFNTEDKARAATNRAMEEATDELIADFSAQTKARAAEIGKMLGGFKAEDRVRVADNRALQEATDKMVADLTAESRARAKDVAQLLADFGNERAEAVAAWRDLLRGMVGAKAPRPKPGPKPKAKPAAIKPEPKPVPREPAEEPTKEGKIRAVLANHPEGLSLSNIGKELGVHFVTLATSIKSLETDRKVEKRENLYFLK